MDLPVGDPNLKWPSGLGVIWSVHHIIGSYIYPSDRIVHVDVSLRSKKFIRRSTSDIEWAFEQNNDKSRTFIWAKKICENI